MEENVQYLDISPISKWRRILLYLGELFVTFIISLTLFSAAFFPLAKVMTSYPKYQEQITTAQHEMNDVLLDNNLLISNPEKDKYDFNASIIYSANLFLVGKVDKSNKNDFINHYFIEIRGKSKEHLAKIYRGIKSNVYFSTVGDEILLKDEYVEEFAPLLDSRDSLTEAGKKDYNQFISGFYTVLFSSVTEDLLQSNEITEESPLYKYRASEAIGQKALKRQHMIAIITTYITHTITCLGLFLLVPLISKKGKTLTMMALRMNRVGNDNFMPLKKSERIIGFFINYIITLPLIMFVPCFYITFAALLSLYQLVFVSLITIFIVFVSMFFIIFSYLGRSLSDLATRSIIISNDDLDMIYSARGII